MTIWLVIQPDYDGAGDSVVAAYGSESLARQHATEMDLECESVEISHELPPEVTDPVRMKNRADEKDKFRVNAPAPMRVFLNKVEIGKIINGTCDFAPITIRPDDVITLESL